MKSSKTKTWFDELKRIWLSKDVGSVKNLLSERFEYYENPLEKPLISLSDVERVWQEVYKQDIKKLEISILIDKETEAVATYSLSYKDQQGVDHISNGIYYVILDLEGKATLFKQWWVSQ